MVRRHNPIAVASNPRRERKEDAGPNRALNVRVYGFYKDAAPMALRQWERDWGQGGTCPSQGAGGSCQDAAPMALPRPGAPRRALVNNVGNGIRRARFLHTFWRDTSGQFLSQKGSPPHRTEVLSPIRECACSKIAAIDSLER